MIHAARKRRQMARDMGVPDDYVSLNTTDENGNNASTSRKSRLVRYENIILLNRKIQWIILFSDDEHDASDDSATEDPHIVNMDRNKTRAESERQKNRDRFLELEQGL
jgi:hypothetical protein